MDWKQELLKRLDALAGKLGTTAEYLWRVLVKQGIAVGIGDLVVCLMCVGGAVVCYKTFKWLNRNNTEVFEDFGLDMGRLACFVGVPILAVIAGCNLYSGILELVNPEYYALHEILQTLGK